MALHPEPSFQHTLREISVNRANPCELVRELISNSYDAGARGLLKPDHKVDLGFWIVRGMAGGTLEPIPQGWHYLSPPEEKTESPAVVHQLRNGRFHARHATTFKHADRHYSVAHEVPVLCLRAMLEATFDVKFRPRGRCRRALKKGKASGRAGRLDHRRAP